MSDDLFKEEKGATELTHEEQLGLIPTYITKKAELNEVEQANIIEGERWAFARTRDILDVDILSELHRRMFGQVWKWAGTYSKENDRRLGSNSYQIPVDLAALVGDAKAWADYTSFPPDEIALRYHHRLTQIHPFPNGNGRFSRLAADMLIKNLGSEPFTWGRTNLVNASETRTTYIDSLKAADSHDFGPLLEFART